jgi:hypothetical protein
LIAAQEATVGLAQGKITDLVPKRNQVNKPTLEDAGIDKKLSGKAQKLAARLCRSESESESKLSSDLSLNFSLARGLAWNVWNELRSMFLAGHWE